ncbi:MAG: MATE family efflux transporter [Candidatus Babeliales bacterium]|jgi:putative MATE family efflux protein
MSTQITVKDVVKLAWPEFFVQMLIVVACITEMFFIGKIGVVYVAAVSIACIVTTLINNFLGECEAGSRTLVAKFFGASDQDKINKAFLVSIIVPFFVGLIVAAFSRQISFLAFYMVGSSDVNQIGYAYLNTVLKAVPFSLTFFSLTGFINGMGDTLSPFFIRVLMHVANVLIDAVLIFGMFGFPKLGIQGAAIASIFTYFLGCVLSAFVIFNKQFVAGKINFNLFKSSFWQNWEVLKEYLKISRNVGFQFGFCDLAMYFLALIIERFGVNALAVHQIVYYQVYSSLQLLIYSFYVACWIIIGKIFGSRDYLGINPAIIKICKIVSVVALVSVATIIAFSSFLGGFFSPLNIEVANASSVAIKLLGLNLLVDALYVVISGGLLGADDSRFVMLQGVFSEYLILLPLAYIFSVTCGMGLIGVYFAFCFRTVFNLLTVGWRFFVSREWNKVENLKPEQQYEPAYFSDYNLQFGLQNLIDEDIFVPTNVFFVEQPFFKKPRIFR